MFTAAFRTKRADRTREDGQKSEKQSCTMNLSFLFARLAQSAERKALNLVVVGSSPMVGVLFLFATEPHHAHASNFHFRRTLRNKPMKHDTLPEWSKGVDSSSTSASCVGSNPTGVTLGLCFRMVGEANESDTAVCLHLTPIVCSHRLVARTSLCGRNNPASTPGVDILECSRRALGATARKGSPNMDPHGQEPL